MIRLQVDRDAADHILTALYVLAGVIPPPTAPPKGVLPLANEIARQLETLPARPEVTQ